MHSVCALQRETDHKRGKVLPPGMMLQLRALVEMEPPASTCQFRNFLKSYRLEIDLTATTIRNIKSRLRLAIKNGTLPSTEDELLETELKLGDITLRLRDCVDKCKRDGTINPGILFGSREEPTTWVLV